MLGMLCIGADGFDDGGSVSQGLHPRHPLLADQNAELVFQRQNERERAQRIPTLDLLGTVGELRLTAQPERGLGDRQHPLFDGAFSSHRPTAGAGRYAFS